MWILATLVSVIVALGSTGCGREESEVGADSEAHGNPDGRGPAVEARPGRGAPVTAAPAGPDEVTRGESAPAPEPGRRKAEALAREALGPFKKKLKAALVGALGEQGPVGAVNVCREVAPRLAREASSKHVKVGRSSSQLRNPGNAAQPWLRPLLAEMEAHAEPRGQSRVVPLPNGAYGYAEAIVIDPPCLMCHGKSLAKPLQERIATLYPNDRATGFELGALRGVFWAEVAAAAGVAK